MPFDLFEQAIQLTAKVISGHKLANWFYPVPGMLCRFWHIASNMKDPQTYPSTLGVGPLGPTNETKSRHHYEPSTIVNKSGRLSWFYSPMYHPSPIW